MNITRKQKMQLTIGAIFVLAIYVSLTVCFGILMSNARDQAAVNHKNRMDPAKVSVQYLPQKAEFTEIKVGTYLDSIHDLSIAESKFSADLYVWFSWTGNKDLNPGETFQIVGGSIDSKELSSAHYLDDGRNYQRYKISVTMNKVFDTSRLSLEDHMLNLYFEDKKHDSASVVYVPDSNSSINPSVKIPGFKVTNFQDVAKPHEYKSSFSSPNATGPSRIFSQYAIGVSVNRTDWGFYLKIYLPFLLSVCLGLIILRSKSELIDARTGLAGASFFGVVANAYVVSTFVPANSGSFGLLDVLNITSLVSVLLIVGVSIFSHNLTVKGDKPEFVTALDKTAFFAIAGGYLLFSLVIPFCTYLSH